MTSATKGDHGRVAGGCEELPGKLGEVGLGFVAQL